MSGSSAFPSVTEQVAPTTTDALDEMANRLKGNAAKWVAVPIGDRIKFLEQVASDTAVAAADWVADALEAKGLSADTPEASDEWLPGPGFLIRNARLLAQTLRDIRQHGTPQLPGKVWQRDDGQTVVNVYPTDNFDKTLLAGVSGEVWMEPGVNPGNLVASMAEAYRPDSSKSAGLCLVLGAGNVSSIGPMDGLYSLFSENKVALIKLHPVNEYLGEHWRRALDSLIKAGFVDIAFGGAEVGSHLTNHEAVDTIHITGSDKTYDAIVFGTGEEGQKRKATDDPVNNRPITAELGNVSPVIVVPGPWSDGDLRFQAAHIAGSLTNNAGFNCNATRVLITHDQWNLRESLLDALGNALSDTPSRDPYYPGAEDQWNSFAESYPDAHVYGDTGSGCIPWTVISHLDPSNPSEVAFNTESFNGVMAEVALTSSRDVSAFLDDAVEFCNNTVWGSLNATILIHPKSLRDPEVVDALDRAVANLKYGSIGVNIWAGLSYALCSTTWGAYPGHPRTDIRSGDGVAHNTYLFDHPQKSVIRAPFRAVPKPLWHAGHATANDISRKMTYFEADPSIAKIPSIVASALRG